MTTAAQALEALQKAAHCYCGAFPAKHYATLRQHIESTAAELATRHERQHQAEQLAGEYLIQRDDARAELEALRKDAERYRWLRERNRNGVSFRNVRGGRIAVYQYEGNPKRRSGEATVIRAEELDAAIDAALNQGGK